MGKADISKGLELLNNNPVVSSTLNKVLSPDIVNSLNNAGKELLNDSKIAPNRPTILNNNNNNQQPIENDTANSLKERLAKI